MSRTITLTNLLAQVRYQASVQGLTVRHSDADLTALINSSIQLHREMVSLEGISNYLVSHSSTLVAGNTSPYKFAVLDLASGPSPALVRVYGFDIIVGNEAKTLHPVAFSERNDYGGEPGEPEAWAPYQLYKIALFPAPAYAYTYVVWYLPKLADLSAGADTFDGVAAWDQWVIWDVVCKVIDRDQFASAFALAANERERCQQLIMNTSKQTGKGVIHRRRDTWGERRRDQRLRRSPWRWNA